VLIAIGHALASADTSASKYLLQGRGFPISICVGDVTFFAY